LEVCWSIAPAIGAIASHVDFFDQLVGRKNRHWVPSTAKPAVMTSAQGFSVPRFLSGAIGLDRMRQENAGAK
jgi:hypothetical protein